MVKKSYDDGRAIEVKKVNNKKVRMEFTINEGKNSEYTNGQSLDEERVDDLIEMLEEVKEEKFISKFEQSMLDITMGGSQLPICPFSINAVSQLDWIDDNIGFEREVVRDAIKADILKLIYTIKDYLEGKSIELQLYRNDLPSGSRKGWYNKKIKRKLRFKEGMGFYVKYKGTEVLVRRTSLTGYSSLNKRFIDSKYPLIDGIREEFGWEF